MYREFRKLLDTAVGTSEYVIVANVDIRGFSAFSTRVDSADTALYVRKVYAQLIDDYFANASFFKPTGDGLLLTVPYDENSLKDALTGVVESSFQLLDEFEALVAGDPMITFETPAAVGVGLSRGSASCLRSGDLVLDYSGRILNLASRLMGLARPSGIVCDAPLGVELLDDHLAEAFATEHVFLPGIAESRPIEVRYSHAYTEIPAAAKRPIREYDWKNQSFSSTQKQLQEGPPLHRIYLEERPIDESQIQVVARHPLATASGRRREGVTGITDDVGFVYDFDAGRPYVSVRTRALGSALTDDGVKDGWEVTVNISYPVAKTT
jgi:class 3 adenylate cyclase